MEAALVTICSLAHSAGSFPGARSALQPPIGNAETALEPMQLLQIDRAHDIHERELPRLAGDDHQPIGPVSIHRHVDLALTVRLEAADFHESLPAGRRKLPAHGVDI